MSTSKEIVFELWRLHERRCYFQMSSAGAGIGYALATTEPNLPQGEGRVLLLSMALWAFSFLCGFKVIKGVAAAMSISKVTIEERAKLPNHTDIHNAFGTIVKESSDKVGARFDFFQTAQMLLLIAGALVFIGLKIDVSEAIWKPISELGRNP